MHAAAWPARSNAASTIAAESRDIAFAVLWWAFHADSVSHQATFQSGWFVVGLLIQTLVVHLLRTPRLPFMQSRAAATLTVTTGSIMALGIWLPWGPLASYFKRQALPPAYYGWLFDWAPKTRSQNALVTP
jgi:Mg2+-importing ATPase